MFKPTREQGLTIVVVAVIIATVLSVVFFGVNGCNGVLGEDDEAVQPSASTPTGDDCTARREPAYFEISHLSVPATVTRGETVNVTARITNTGGATGTQAVRFDFDAGNATAGIRPLDVVFLVDTSASMTDEIDTVKSELEEFAGTLSTADTDARYAVVTFGNGAVTVAQDYTASVAQTRRTLATLDTSGGAEYNYRAIETALTDLSPRPNARVVIIDLTDENTDRGPADPTQNEVATMIESAGATYIAVSPNRSALETSNGDTSSVAYNASLDKRVLANQVENGVYFDIHEGNFSEKFQTEIATTVAGVTNSQPITLESGERTTVTFTVDTSDFATGGVTATVASENDSESASSTIVT